MVWSRLLLCLPLPAYSSYAPPDAMPGMRREEVIARMGQPDLERQQASHAQQVLTEPNFNRVDVGMTQEQVSQLLGRPSEVWLLGRERGHVWNYRFEADCK